MKRFVIVSLLLAAALGQALAAGHGMIRFKIGSFAPGDELPSYAALGLERLPGVSGAEWYIVQFAGTPQEAWTREIVRLGGAVSGDYIPDDACLVRMTPAVRAAVERLPQVRFVAFHQPAFRINPDLLAPQTPVKGEPDGRITLRVVAFESGAAGALNDRLAGMEGVSVEKTGATITRISVPADAAVAVAKAIAHDPDVYWVSRQYPAVLHNAWTRWINQSRDSTGMASGSTWYAKLRIQSADDSLKMPIYARGIYGQNQVVGVDDSGIDWTNVYHRDTQKPTYDTDKDTVCEVISTHRKIVAYNVNDGDKYDLNSSGHGTHTTGTVAGDSLGSTHPASTVLERAMGMAPRARLAFTDIGRAGDALYMPTDLSDIYIWAYNAGARITSSSWGYSAGGPSNYDVDEQNIDKAGWFHKDLLMFRSAGNDNTSGDSCNSPATAKDIVCVGASESGYGYNATSWSNPGSNGGNGLRNVAEFSSHGPTKEGMRRPHLLAAGGWYVWSADSDGDTVSTNSGITYMGGTSMASPAAAGLCALVRQYYTDGFYPSGSATPANALTPSGALMKATMIASTRNSPGAYSTDAINSTATKNVPSQGQGWGAVVLDDALYFDGDARRTEVHDVTPGFASAGQSDVYTVGTGPSTSQGFKVVLVWTDYYSALPVTDILVNDLHLEVSDGVNTYRGSVFGTGGYSATGGTADTKNCEEVVWLDGATAASKSFTITVRANAVNHGPQPYALVIVGDLASNLAPSRPALAKPFDYAGIPTLTPTVTFSATDFEGDAVSYEVALDTKPDFSTATTYATGTYASGASVDYTFPALTAGTTYWWRVRAQDPAGSGYFGQASESRSFTIDPAIVGCSWVQRTAGQFGGNAFVRTELSGDSVIVQASGAGSDTTLRQDFEGGAMPAGWTAVQNQTPTDSYYWTVGTAADLSTYTPPSFGTAYAYYNDDDAGSSNPATIEDLVSPVINLTGGTTGLSLSYGYGYRDYSTPSESLYVQVRFASGGAWGGWITKNIYKGTSVNGTATLNLNAHLPADSMQVRWRYDDGSAGWGYVGAVDNVFAIRSYNLVINDGSMTSLPVAYADFNASFPGSHSDWGYVHLWKLDPADSIGCQVEYLSGGAWALVPDGALPGNAAGYFDNTGTVVTRNLTGLSTATYDTIRAVARLYNGSGKASARPVLHRLEVGSTSADPLGVALSNLAAAATDDGVVITWRTESETECLRWEVGRLSSGIEGFQTIGRLDGHGTTSQPSSYRFTDDAKLAAGTYHYRLTEVDLSGARTHYGVVSVNVGKGVPSVSMLGRSLPNPSPAGRVTIAFGLKSPGNTSLRIYNIQGQVVRTLVSGEMKAGYHQAAWDGRDHQGRAVTSGVYLYQLVSGDFSATRKLMVLR